MAAYDFAARAGARGGRRVDRSGLGELCDQALPPASAAWRVALLTLIVGFAVPWLGTLPFTPKWSAGFVLAAHAATANLSIDRPSFKPGLLRTSIATSREPVILEGGEGASRQHLERSARRTADGQRVAHRGCRGWPLSPGMPSRSQLMPSRRSFWQPGGCSDSFCSAHHCRRQGRGAGVGGGLRNVSRRARRRDESARRFLPWGSAIGEQVLTGE